MDPKNTDKHEPVVWVAQYGKGRVCENVLGHDVAAMKSPGFPGAADPRRRVGGDGRSDHATTDWTEVACRVLAPLPSASSLPHLSCSAVAAVGACRGRSGAWDNARNVSRYSRP